MKKVQNITFLLTISVVSFAFAANVLAQSQGLSGVQGAQQKKKEEKKKEKKNRPEIKSKLRMEINGKATFHALTGGQSMRSVYKVSPDPLVPPATGPTESKAKDEPVMFSVDSSKISFKVLGDTDAGLNYSLLVSLTGDTNATKSVKEAYIRLGDAWGTLLLGDTSGPEDFMTFGGFSNQVGSGGFDGKFDRMLNVTTGVKVDVSLPGDTADTTKFVYVTPRLEGAQLGFAYTPDTKHDGSAKMKTEAHPDGDSVFDRNSIALGLNYIRKFNDFELKFSVTGIAGTTRPEKEASVAGALDRENTRALAVGGVVEYKGFSFGAEYIWAGKSHQFKTPVTDVDPGKLPDGTVLTPISYEPGKARAANVFNVGASYAFSSCTTASVGYYHSYRKTGFADHKATADTFSGGVEHKISEGFTTYIEYAHHNLKNPSAFYEAKMQANALGGSAKAVPNNRSNTVILGTKIQF